jgi:poly-gamma-glutamate biosynthesis protein PgsC/CapC
VSEAELLTIAIGLAMSLLFSELLGVAPGGIIVPGYLALYIDDPIQVGLTLAVAMLTWFIVHSLATVAIVYGRRRTVLMILTGFLLGSLVRVALEPGTPVGVFELDVIGYIVPGLIAIWIDRQGALTTLSTALTASIATRLAVLLIAGLAG